MKSFWILLLLTVYLYVPCNTSACTTILVGKEASADGSVMVSHSDDGLGDGSMVYVPAMDHPSDTLRPVYYAHYALGYNAKWGASSSHRLVTNDRGPGYLRTDTPPSIPLGYIPQVPHTYAYFDANYGIMNEHQLSIGECTDPVKVYTDAAPDKRIFYSAELSRVALERCKTAREAITLMGDLIDKYGYYGTGETLLVADPNEGWVMEMASYDENGTGGVWVAQKVPDDQVFVAANQFRIREVSKDNANMIFSSNIFEIAQKKGWWKPDDGALDFAKVYGNGEFQHPYYSLRRVWRVQSLVAPSLNLSPWVDGADTCAYPFAVKPDHKLSVKDLFSIYRDHYEGTEFDLTQGPAAGPFGNPTRYEGRAETAPDKEGKKEFLRGQFERPLDIYRCVYAYVNQSRSWLPDTIGGVTWFGFDRPSTTVLIPFYAGVTNLPESVQRANVLTLDRTSLWTAFNYVANYSMLKYSYMIKDIRNIGDAYEDKEFSDQAGLEAEALNLWNHGEKQGTRNLLTQYSDKLAANILSDWWKLSDSLYIKYNDGYINTNAAIGQRVFYPAAWLQQVGYESGPVEYQKPN